MWSEQNNRIPLDELQYKQCMEEIYSDPELKTLESSLTSLMQTAIPTSVIVGENSVEYIYSPEVTELKAKIEKRIEERITELQNYHGLLRI